MSKWILVSGGAGFIGTNLCKKLLNKGKKVLCVDNFSTSNRANLHQFFGNPDFKLLEGDITLDLDELGIKRYELECIYNLACPASPPQYQRLSLETLAVNSMGMENLLKLAASRGIKILQTSTSEVYGEPEVSPQSENYRGNVNCFGPRSCYDEGKRFAEALCFEYKRVKGVDVRLVRIFNTYGPWLNPTDGRVVSNFMIQAKTGLPITLYGDGQQSRSFCFVDDTVDGIIALMEAQKNDLDAVPIYNIGNPNEITVTELATTIIGVCESRSELAYEPLPTDDPTQRCPDIHKALRDLNWSGPKVSLKEGLRRTSDHFNEVLKCENYNAPVRLYTTMYHGRRIIIPPATEVTTQIDQPLRPHRMNQ
ncbi:MAG: NAD-dependent epimerase/dehydratase family protein [Candidatus Berkiella sp.]